MLSEDGPIFGVIPWSDIRLCVMYLVRVTMKKRYMLITSTCWLAVFILQLIQLFFKLADPLISLFYSLAIELSRFRPHLQHLHTYFRCYTHNFSWRKKRDQYLTSRFCSICLHQKMERQSKSSSKGKKNKKNTKSNLNTQGSTCSFSCWISSFFSWMSLVRLCSLCLMSGPFWLLWESCNWSADTSSFRAEIIQSFLWASLWDDNTPLCSSLHLTQLSSYRQQELYRNSYVDLNPYLASQRWQWHRKTPWDNMSSCLMGGFGVEEW